MQSHITDEDLEAYSKGKSQLGVKRVEMADHILICEYCRIRQDEMDIHVATARASHRLIEARDRQRQDEN